MLQARVNNIGLNKRSAYYSVRNLLCDKDQTRVTLSEEQAADVEPSLLPSFDPYSCILAALVADENLPSVYGVSPGIAA